MIDYQKELYHLLRRIAGPKHTAIQEFTATLPGGSQQILGPNEKRIGIIIGTLPSNAIRVTISINSPAVLDLGLNIAPATVPLYLTWTMLGDAIRGPIFAIPSAGTTTMGGWDIMAL